MSLDYTVRSRTPKKKHDYESYHRSRSAKKSDRSNDSNKSPQYQVNYNINSLKKSIEYTKSHANLDKNKVFTSNPRLK